MRKKISGKQILESAMNQITKLQSTKQLVTRMEEQFRNALPPQVPSKKFVRTIQTAISDPMIADKINKGQLDQTSLLNACMKAAQDGLCLDNREAALITFYNKKQGTNTVSYIPMVGGLLKKARQSGDVSTISAAVVFENDEFDYWIDEKGEHMHYRPCSDRKNKGAPIKAFAICVLKDGGSQIAVMEEDEIMAVANHSKNTDQYIPGKGPWFGEWWKKAALRRLAKTMPSSSDLERVFEHDNENYESFEEAEIVDHPKDIQQPGKTRAASVVLGDDEPEEASYTEVPEVAESTDDDPI